MIATNNKNMFRLLEIEDKPDRFIFGGYKIIHHSIIKDTFFESKLLKTFFDGYHVNVKYGLILKNDEKFTIFEINDAPLSNKKIAKCVKNVFNVIIEFNNVIADLIAKYRKQEILTNIFKCTRTNR